MRVPALIQKELETCGVPYRIEQDDHHGKIYLGENGGFMCGIFPTIGKSPNRRAELNVRSQIRRQARKLKGLN